MSDKPSREAMEAVDNIEENELLDLKECRTFVPEVRKAQHAHIIDAAFAPTLKAADELAKEAENEIVDHSTPELLAALTAYRKLRGGTQ